MTFTTVLEGRHTTDSLPEQIEVEVDADCSLEGPDNRFIGCDFEARIPESGERLVEYLADRYESDIVGEAIARAKAGRSFRQTIHS